MRADELVVGRRYALLLATGRRIGRYDGRGCHQRRVDRRFHVFTIDEPLSSYLTTNPERDVRPMDRVGE